MPLDVKALEYSVLDSAEHFSEINLCLQAIEEVKTDKGDKPYQDVKMLNVMVPKSQVIAVCCSWWSV